MTIERQPLSGFHPIGESFGSNLETMGATLSGCQLTPESQVPCLNCGAILEPREVEWKGQIFYWQRPCPCRDQVIDERERKIADMDATYRRAQAFRGLGDTGMKLVEGFALESFDPRKLKETELGHPYTLATKWINDIIDAGDVANYHDGPPAALYFLSPGKGRGKTHLAAGLMWEIQNHHKKLAVFLDETTFIERRWATTSFEEKERLASLPGSQAWLTVIDDLGNHNGGQGVADTWYAVFNRRWLKRGWTIITSNFTPEQLLEKGTINDATYSRLRQMIQSTCIFFDGKDIRLQKRSKKAV
jgi:hypothetical protein